MKAVPLELKDANAYVEKYHRHHKSVSRDKFRVGCEEGGELVGIIQVGRPLSRHLCDGETLEVLRCCTNGRPQDRANYFQNGTSWKGVANEG